MDFINENLNIFIGSIIFIILGIVGYFFYNKNTVEEFKNPKPQIIIKEDNIINDYLEKEFSKVLKIFSEEVKKSAQSMVKFNDKFLLQNDYLNFRNSLYTKDIEKHSLLVDTKNMCHCKDKHSYVFKLDSNEHNETGGLGVFKNVIGFRLIKATLQNLHYTIHSGNNKLKFKYNDSDTIHIITLESKNYDSENDIAKELETKMNGVPEVGSGVTVSYDESTRKFTIDHSTNNLALLFSTTTSDGSSIYRLLGFNNVNTGFKTDAYISDNVSDISIHFVDVAVNEIPYIACKKNPQGKSIIDRIPIDTSINSLVHYRAPETDYFSQNYFYPITLSQLTIDLFEDTHNIPYYNENSDNFFEFEITMLKNTKLSN